MPFIIKSILTVSTHSRPKAAGYGKTIKTTSLHLFQHTAARRRLAMLKAKLLTPNCFNTQPPEGGWLIAHLWNRL